MILSESAHCAIILVAELARFYGKQGITSVQVSDKHCVPVGLIEQVVKVLEVLMIVTVKNRTDAEPLLYLAREPELLKTEDIILPFDKEAFCGVFLNEDTGELLQQSALTRCINKERDYINNYLRKRYRAMNLTKWIEYSDNSTKLL